MLKFIGRGSAFNTELGNNSCFIKDSSSMLLIDCGSNIFDRLLREKVLDNLNNLCVLITHKHPDHVGSLGDLIFYMYYIKGMNKDNKIKLICPKKLKIVDLLDSMGVWRIFYDLIELEDDENINIDLVHNSILINPILVEHYIGLDCYGYEIKYKNKYIYYSGDSNNISDFYLERINNLYYDYIFQDTCSATYENNPHLSIGNLSRLITEEKIRGRVYCMHLDNNFDEEYAEYLGFKVVK